MFGIVTRSLYITGISSRTATSSAPRPFEVRWVFRGAVARSRRNEHSAGRCLAGRPRNGRICAQLIANTNHFTILDELRQPNSTLTRAVIAMADYQTA